MTDGYIPTNVEDLAVDTVPLEESAVYSGLLRKATINPKVDKNGYIFAALQLEITDGDYEGRTVMMNYLPLPTPFTDDMSKAERIKAQDKSTTFARFCRAYGIKGKMPAVALHDRDSIASWQEWVTRFYGNNGKFTVRNQEFPEGSGRLRSGVSDFVF